MEKVTAMDPVKGSIVIVTTASVSSTINISTFLDTQVSLAPTLVRPSVGPSVPEVNISTYKQVPLVPA